MCLLIYTYILCFFHHLPKMKPMESPTAGLEVVQASRTQQAFQIRQQLLQFGLLFWGAPMTLTGITSYPLTTVGVSYLFSKQAPTWWPWKWEKDHGHLGHKILKQAQVLFAPVLRTTKIAHPFTGRIQADGSVRIGFRRKLEGEKRNKVNSGVHKNIQKQNKRIEMKWLPPMPTQWLPLECWLVQFNHHNYHHHWYHWYSEIHHLSIINTNQLSRFLRKLQAQPTPGSWKAPPCGTPPSPRALQGSAFRSPSAAGRCGAAGSRAAPPAPTGKWWWWIMCI